MQPHLFKLLYGNCMLELVTNKEKYFAKNEKQFLEYLHKKNGTTLTKDNLVFKFFDLEGNGYYEYPSTIYLPMSRLAKLQEYLMWISAGVSGDELDGMLKKADKALSDGVKNGKGAAVIGFIIQELMDRKNMVIHEELFYNFIAAQLIRHDESPTQFNNEIHLQKVESFKAMNKKDDTFFLIIQEYLKVLNLSNITKDDLDKLLAEANQRSAAMKKVLQRELENA